LQKIAKEKGNDSYEFELKAKELDNLGKEIDKIATSDDYVNNVKVLEWNGKDLNMFLIRMNLKINSNLMKKD
jgi:hypothetical protein